MLPIEPGCTALFLGTRLAEARTVKVIDRAMPPFKGRLANGRTANLTPIKTDMLWEIDEEICVGTHVGSFFKAYARLAYDHELMRLDGNDDEFLYEEQSEKPKTEELVYAPK